MKRIIKNYLKTNPISRSNVKYCLAVNIIMMGFAIINDPDIPKEWFNEDYVWSHDEEAIDLLETKLMAKYSINFSEFHKIAYDCIKKKTLVFKNRQHPCLFII